MNLDTKKFPALDGGEVLAYYRPGTSDEDVLPEVVERHGYARRSVGFDVMPGERWLDLGANIGAFAIYCRTRGATAECYEPDPDCFSVLKKNATAAFDLHNCAVTNQRKRTLAFHKSANPKNHWRATILPVSGYVDHPAGALANQYAGTLMRRRYDGVKMDIEGSEFGLLDDALIPPCSKLVMEYHYLRDKRNLTRFLRRMKTLEKRFKNVWYPAFVKRDIIAKRDYSGRFDSCVYAWDPR